MRVDKKTEGKRVNRIHKTGSFYRNETVEEHNNKTKW